MRGDKLAISNFNDVMQTIGELSGEQVATAGVPTVITADAILNEDYPRIDVDCTGGNIILTLTEAQKMVDFTWTIRRIDTSSDYTCTIVGETGELINGQASWALYHYETVSIHTQLSSYDLK